jgi:hypothetical protein
MIVLKKCEIRSREVAFFASIVLYQCAILFDIQNIEAFYIFLFLILNIYIGHGIIMIFYRCNPSIIQVVTARRARG